MAKHSNYYYRLSAHVLGHEFAPFKAWIDKGDMLRPLEGMSEAQEDRWELLIIKLDRAQSSSRSSTLDEQELGWLAAHSTGHIYCDAARATGIWQGNIELLKQEHSTHIIPGKEAESVVLYMGWPESDVDRLARDFISETAQKKGFAEYVAKRAIMELENIAPAIETDLGLPA